MRLKKEGREVDRSAEGEMVGGAGVVLVLGAGMREDENLEKRGV